MKKLSLCIAVLFIAASFAAADDLAVRSYEKVTPMGVETITEYGPYSMNALGEVSLTGSRNTPGGLVWNYPDAGLGWICSNVSVGHRGTQVCAVCYLNNERIEFFSVFDDNPPVPIWTDTSIYGTSTGYMCDSTSKGDYFIVKYDVDKPDIMNRDPHVNFYSSSSSTPIWTWNYGSTINAASKAAIDRDGKVVAVAVNNNNTGMIELFFLNPADGSVMSTYSQVTQYGLRGFDLSADGSTLYFHDGGYGVNIFDIASNSVIFTATTGGSFDGHCISGDGTKFAFGGFGSVAIWEYDGANWNSYNLSTPSGTYGDEMDFSDDGTTLGYGISQYSPAYTKCTGVIFDVANKQKVSEAVWDSTGSTYQDVCVGASISRDGKYFALARWGDQFNTNDEVQILEFGNNTPVGSIDTRGSAYHCDISADGQVTASGCKAVHANVSGRGGDVDCYDLGDEDVAINGKPTLGGSFVLETYGTAGDFYAPVYSVSDNPAGVTTPYGRYFLNVPPNQLTVLFKKTMPTGGVALDTVNLPSAPSFVGMTRYLQVVHIDSTNKRTLSKDYVAITILP